ncbi:MAG: cytochrome c biogenesis protein CcsA [Bacteroidaceae bacterium]
MKTKNRIHKSIECAIGALYVFITLVIGGATFVEKGWGMVMANALVYDTPWFVAAWVLLTLFSLVYMFRQQLYKRKWLFLLHLSFVVILLGAFLTHLTAIKGSMHLREGESSNFMIGKGNQVIYLPFALRLDSFRVVRHLNSNAPANYVSTLSVITSKTHKAGITYEEASCVVSMNHIFKQQGYRIYQTSYDSDEQGTLLSVYRDPWGIGLSYAGYALFLLSFLGFMLNGRGHFRLLLKKLGQPMMVLFLLHSITSCSFHTELKQLYMDASIIPLWLFRVALCLGVVGFVVCTRNTLRGERSASKSLKLLRGFLFIFFLLLTYHIALRTLMSGRLPFGNGYETMLSTAWCVMLTALVLARRTRWAIAFGLLLSGFCLLVSTLRVMNPEIAPLVPVLSSSLLSIHVSVIMMAYALLGFTSLSSGTALLLWRFKGGKQNAYSLMLLCKVLLYPALLLLGVGIFVGAVWANVSWGTYWSWDPKEVWALITFMVYSVIMHEASMPWLSRPLPFHFYLLMAFFTVLMTYFGVNYFLGGLHSYGN